MKRLRDRQLRTSRVLLTTLGALLVAIALVGGLLATSAVDRLGAPLDASTPVLNGDGQELLADHQLAFQIGAVVVGAALILVAIWWLRQQIPPVRHQGDEEFTNADEERPGSNTVRGGALAHALESDLERAEAVRRARAEFRTDDDVVRLRLDVVETAPVNMVMSDIVDPAIDRISRVAEFGQRPRVHTDLRPVEAGGREVY